MLTHPAKRQEAPEDVFEASVEFSDFRLFARAFCSFLKILSF